jgi:hypothetical protein
MTLWTNPFTFVEELIGLGVSAIGPEPRMTLNDPRQVFLRSFHDLLEIEINEFSFFHFHLHSQ